MEKLKKHPILLLAGAIVILVIGVWLTSDSIQVSVDRNGVDVALGGEANLDQLDLNWISDNANASTTENRRWKTSITDKISSGEQHGYWCNDPANGGVRGDVFVDYSYVMMLADSNGTEAASSSFAWDIATATGGDLVEEQSDGNNLGIYASSTNNSVFPFASIMDTVRFSTSSGNSDGSFASTTDNISLITRDDRNNAGVIWQDQSYPVRVRQSECIVGRLAEWRPAQPDLADRCSSTLGEANNAAGLLLCEAATSTARGFDLEWGVNVFTTTTPEVQN